MSQTTTKLNHLKLYLSDFLNRLREPFDHGRTIQRDKSARQFDNCRQKSLNRAHNYTESKTQSLHLVEKFGELLKGITSLRRTQSQDSDVRQLAKAAASGVGTLLSLATRRVPAVKSKDIAELTGLEVINPVELILRMHELD